ncbi:ABC transporter ATP-binding protein [Microbacterium sp.]|uniref:ABC transporter ATP-binding protein n=1 Tax=Microbacterium sp. TaxID=51671 RepID=UPI003C736614
MSVITVRGLAKSFGTNRAVRDVSFTVERGETLGILGPNGAGKSTTVECIGAMTKPESGTIRVLGMNPFAEPVPVRRALGYQMQSTTLPAQLRVGEALRMFAAFYPDPMDDAELLEAVGLSEVAGRAFGVLSGGQRQRLSIALALVGRPRVLILDEITTGLDPEGRRDVWKLIEDIRASGVTVLLVSHAIDEVERLCDRIAVIVDGRSVYTGTPAQLIRRVLPDPEITGARSLEDAYLKLVAEQRMEG